MTNDDASGRVSLLWILMLTVASFVTTLVFKCATPFPALAALAAVYLNRRDGVLLMLAAWAVSQIVGFGFHDYPLDTGTMLTGLAIGVAAVVSSLAASVAGTAIAQRHGIIRLAVAYCAGFVAFKAAILLASPVIGHADVALSIEIMVRQFVRNAAILAGLVVLYRGSITLGVPAAPAGARAIEARA